jgi:hypothetical protein
MVDHDRYEFFHRHQISMIRQEKRELRRHRANVRSLQSDFNSESDAFAREMYTREISLEKSKVIHKRRMIRYRRSMILYYRRMLQFELSRELWQERLVQRVETGPYPVQPTMPEIPQLRNP